MATYYVADTENNVPKSDLYTNDGEVIISSLGEMHSEGIVDPFNKLAELEEESETRVWAAALCPVKENPEPEDVNIKSSIYGFLVSCSLLKTRSPVIFFHNASYDLSFVMTALLRMGYKAWEPDGDQRLPGKGEFSTILSGDGKWYSLGVRFENGKYVEFRDSNKLLPFGVEKIGKDLKTKAQKLVGGIDYSIPRGVDWVITPEEERYIQNDVLVMAEALHKIKDTGLLECLTIGAHCMQEFKATLTPDWKKQKAAYDNLFPAFDLETDAKLRKAYRGAWCYNNTNGEIRDMRERPENIEVYDVNSLYPSVMYSHIYPYGETFTMDEQKFDKIKNIPLMPYIIHVNIAFTVKDNHLPFLQIKNSIFRENEYITDTIDVVEMTLTKPDYELLLEQYDVSYFEFIEGWYWMGSKNIFDEYIDKFYKMKEQATLEKNEVMRLVAKLHLNNLYGKMATNPRRESGVPYLDENEILCFERVEIESRGGFIPAGAFCTAYARGVTVRAAQRNYDRFLYSDTDSIHLIGEAEGIEVHDTKLGAWAHEGSADMGRYVRQKTYIERLIFADDSRKIDIKACGCPKGAKERMLYKVTDGNTFYPLERDENDNIISERRSDDEIFERFTYGLVEAGKLQRRRVSGGTILKETTFKILP